MAAEAASLARDEAREDVFDYTVADSVEPTLNESVLMRLNSMLLGRKLSGSLLFLAGAASLIIPEGYVWAPAGLILLGMLCVGRGDMLPASVSPMLWAVGLFGAYCAARVCMQDGYGKPVWAYLSYGLGAFIALAVWRLKPAPGWWFAGAAVGALLAVIWAVWQKLALGVDRATGHIYVIQFGNIGLLLGVVSLLGILYFRAHPPCLWRTAALLTGALSGALVSILSGTRGGWIGVPLLLWLLWRAFAPFLSLRERRLALGMVLAGLVLLPLVPQTGVAARMAQLHDELVRHIEGAPPGPSVGQRLQLWPFGWGLLQEKPLLGWGKRGYEQERDRRMLAGELNLEKPFSHVHSEMLDVAVKRGLPAGLLMLLALLVPVMVFRRDSLSDDPALRALATAGMALPLLALDFGLTDLFLESKSGRYIYFGWMPMIYALYANARYRQDAIS